MSSFIPDTAPFNKEQRAWLNGFFNGLMGIQPGMSAGEALAAANIGSPMAEAPAAEEEEDFPWHDDSLPIIDRMELAEGKPLERRLMAAMAQLDCGTCGYVCQTYAEAIASGEESSLTLCSPGGKETKQMLKQLLKEESDNGSAAPSNTPANGSSSETDPIGTRKRPLLATLIESRRLNKDGSAKDTRHVAIDLNGSELQYDVGDALGIFPSNCGDLVKEIVTALGADPSAPVTSPMGNKKSLSEALCEDCCLKEPSDELLELLISHCDEKLKQPFAAMLDDGAPEGFDVLDAVQLASCSTMSATEFVESLAPMNPRLYSIASSMKSVGNQVHLTVGKVTFEREGRERKGVASTMLADRVDPGTALRVFRQPNHGGFTVPSDPGTPMIMVGPGTGIAPFVAFLQERDATKAPGKNWLFFGDQRRDFDFLYEDDLSKYVESGLLNRLDTAFSRDGDKKVYVQDRMLENAAELWQWLQEGAYFYVCGDASRMAKDVHQTLIEIVSQHGSMSVEDATKFVKQLSDDKRYVRDVY